MIIEDSDIRAALMMRIRQSSRWGSITAVDDSGKVQRAQVTVSPREIYDAVPRVPEFGLASNPPIGSDAVVLFFAGDASNGVVIGTNNQSARLLNLGSGEMAIYDAFGKYVKLTQAGITVEANHTPVTVNNATNVTVNASGAVTVNSQTSTVNASASAKVQAPTITLKATTSVIADTPLFECTGDIIDNSGSQSSSMADLRAAHDGHTHNVPNIQTGTGSRISAGPSITV